MKHNDSACGFRESPSFGLSYLTTLSVASGQANTITALPVITALLATVRSGSNNGWAGNSQAGTGSWKNLVCEEEAEVLEGSQEEEAEKWKQGDKIQIWALDPVCKILPLSPWRFQVNFKLLRAAWELCFGSVSLMGSLLQPHALVSLLQHPTLASALNVLPLSFLLLLF